MRAIWKGHIRFSLVTIPVRIYSAIETNEIVRFNQLHKKDNGRIGYEKKCKKCGEAVANDEIVKGFEYEPDQYVLIDDDDFSKLRLKSTRIIEIEGFVDQSEVHPTLFDAPYFAGPDGPVAATAYGLLTETLRNSGKMGIGRVVLRDRESVMMLAPQGDGLLLYKLRFPNEVRKMEDVPQLDEVSVDKAQLKLAETLVDSMTVAFSDLALEDRYKDALDEMVKAKIEGEQVVTVEEEEAPVVDIMTALKQSIEQAKAEAKPMAKATGKAAKAAAEADEDAVAETATKSATKTSAKSAKSSKASSPRSRKKAG